MEKCIIVAIADNGAIGKDNELLWHIKDDLKHFKELTYGHPVIMGSKTYESIGKALPGRTNIVITSRDVEYNDAKVVHSVGEAYWEAEGEESDRCFIIGGGSIYGQTIKDADRLFVTHVHEKYDGDTFFPPFSENMFGSSVPEWMIVDRKDGKDEKSGIEYSFCEYERFNKRKMFNPPVELVNGENLTSIESETIMQRVVSNEMIRSFYNPCEIKAMKCELESIEIDNRFDNTVRKIIIRADGMKAHSREDIELPTGKHMSSFELSASLSLLSPLGKTVLGRNKRILYSNGEKIPFKAINLEKIEEVKDARGIISYVSKINGETYTIKGGENRKDCIYFAVYLSKPDTMEYAPKDGISGALAESINGSKDEFILSWAEEIKKLPV